MAPWRIRILRSVGIGTILAVFAIVALFRWASAYLPLEFAYPRGFDPPESYPFKFENLYFTADDGASVNAWYVPAPGSQRVLLVFHGSAVNLGFLGHGLLTCHTQLGVNVLAIDYRGYGKSRGIDRIDHLKFDAEAAWRYLTTVRNFAPKDIFLYGQSMGGVVAVDLAVRDPSGGGIIEATQE